MLRKTTRGVDRLCAIKSGQNEDGSDRIMKTWHPLNELKESYPIEVAEFVVARGVDKMPAVAWWVSFTLKKRDTIIASMRSRVARITHKYGIEIPTSWNHAKEVDARNKNHLWEIVLAKEMKNVGVAFDVLEDHENVLVGWLKVSGHLIWDVKMDFTRKARWVKDGHRTVDLLLLLLLLLLLTH